MVSVRSLRATYLCLKDDPYTDYYTVLSREEQSTTPSTVLCSVSSPQLNYNQHGEVAHHFSLLFVPPATAAEWRLL